MGDLTAGHKYRIEVELHEFGLGEANVSGLVKITVAGEVVLGEQMSDYSHSQDRYHPAIAHTTQVYEITVDEDCHFAVTETFASGETWPVTVYDNVPTIISVVSVCN